MIQYTKAPFCNENDFQIQYYHRNYLSHHYNILACKDK